jgi:hypothetical protein
VGKAVLVIGESKAGKSTSLRNLDPSKTIVFSVLNKGLPFKSSAKKYTIWNKESNPNGNVIVTSSAKVITQWLKFVNDKLPHVNVCVIDDSTFLSAKELDRRRDENGYNKFNDVAHDFLVISETANSLRPDLNVYFMHHVTTEGDGILEPKKIKALSHGKMINEKLCSVEAQFEIVFLACKLVDDNNNISYKFKTRDANSTCGTPLGMFEDEYIDNDLQLVNDAINCFYHDCEEDVLVEAKIKKVKEA